MLTSSSNQYLRPEYLTPLPTTLDAKKSPLALLAQTCSQIGADPPVPPNSSAKGSGGSSINSSGNSGLGSPHSSLSTSTIAKSKSSTTTTTSSGSAKSQPEPPTDRPRKSSPQASADKVSKRSREPAGPEPLSGPSSSSPASSTDEKSGSAQSARTRTPTSKATTPPNKSPPVTPAPDSGPSSAKPAPDTSSSKLNLSGPLTFSTASSIDLALKHGLPFPGLYPAFPSGGTSVPPYLHSYARLKAAAGGTGTAEPLTCRDPFCAGCTWGGHGLKACPAGCLQCDHHKGVPPPFGLPYLPHYNLLSLYSGHSALTPYVCSWFVGETYCGKRFSSSDDLLQHLRSHTSGASQSQEAVQSLAAAAAAAGYPAHHHALHGLLSRTYPTPPLSPLGSARFHPYSKPGASGSTLSLSNSSPGLGSGFLPPGFTGLGHPAFSPYYPYSLYGQRGSLHP